MEQIYIDFFKKYGISFNKSSVKERMYCCPAFGNMCSCSDAKIHFDKKEGEGCRVTQITPDNLCFLGFDNARFLIEKCGVEDPMIMEKRVIRD